MFCAFEIDFFCVFFEKFKIKFCFKKKREKKKLSSLLGGRGALHLGHALFSKCENFQKLLQFNCIDCMAKYSISKKQKT